MKRAPLMAFGLAARLSALALLVAAPSALAATPAPPAAPAKVPVVDVSVFSRIPVQHGGRVKPFDTFARHHLLLARQSDSMPGKSAAQWLTGLVLGTPGATGERVFKVRNPEVLSALSLETRQDHLYSMDELLAAMRPRAQMLAELHRRPREQRSLAEGQLVDLYTKVLTVMDLAGALSCVTPDLRVDDPTLAKELGLQPGQGVSYYRLLKQRAAIAAMVKQADSATDARKKALGALGRMLQARQAAATGGGFTILPPKDPAGTWLSPWTVLDGRPLTPTQTKALDALDAAVASIAAGDTGAWNQHLTEYLDAVYEEIAPVVSRSTLSLEVSYNAAKPFVWSNTFYIIAFLLLALSWLGWHAVGLRRVALGALVVGVLLHATGIVLRVIIMDRPPVATLYESVVFVGFIAALSGLILERARRTGLGILMGAVAGSVLHFLGFSYAAEGDTMGMLVAVLNSKFWLATHVVTIAIGYGTALAAGMAGHFYLYVRAFHPDQPERHDEVARNMRGLTLVAIFFTTLGTILGGIWADQSWGRFWGWDPKENGALFIVLWLLVIVHGRLGGQLRDLGYATWLVLGNVVVAVAWFGVNLLNVGLHSYGFTAGVANGLLAFGLGEALIAGVGYGLARRATARLARDDEGGASV